MSMSESSPSPSEPPVLRSDASAEYYVDRRGERAYIGLRTIHYPGRPRYKCPEQGSSGGGGRRYYEVCGKWSHSRDGVAHREESYMEMLRASPADVQLWLQYIHYLEEYGAEGAALVACSQAHERVPQWARAHIGAERLRIAAACLPHSAYTAMLKELICADAADVSVWPHLLLAADTASAAGAVVAAAVNRPHTQKQYMHLIYVYGGYLRAAGLIERLVTLIELMITMNCPPPPKPFLDENDHVHAGDEDDGRLPLSNSWPRAERARAAAQWRAQPACVAAHSDPQCAPSVEEMAPLLRPVSDSLLLLVTALRLAKVPMSPHTEYAHVALHGSHAALAQVADTDAACLLPLLEAAAAHARPHPSSAALCLRWSSPPHYLSDEHGYLSWVEWLWDCACHWLSGAERQALLCWRIRWHGALLEQMRASAPRADYARESRRVRHHMKGALREWGTALSFAEFSRMESCDEEAARTCIAAMFHTANECPREARIYASRACPRALCALAISALGRPLPRACLLNRDPNEELLAAALEECERRCDEIERRVRAEEADDDDDEVDVCALLLPSEGEWARARGLLCSEGRLRALCEIDGPAAAGASLAARRWREENTEGLVIAARRYPGLAPSHAWRLRNAYPHNAVLAYEAGRVPLWRAVRSGSAPLRCGDARGATLPALGELLPALLRAEAEDWTAASAGRVLRAARRATACCAGGPLLWSVLACAEARAGSVRGAVLRGLQCRPQHKWLYVIAAECGALPTLEAIDLLMERELRLHSMPKELLEEASQKH